jgi:hypothetical protein
MEHPLNASLREGDGRQGNQYIDPKIKADRLDLLQSIQFQRALISQTKEVVRENLRNYRNSINSGDTQE